MFSAVLIWSHISNLTIRALLAPRSSVCRFVTMILDNINMEYLRPLVKSCQIGKPSPRPCTTGGLLVLLLLLVLNKLLLLIWRQNQVLLLILLHLLLSLLSSLLIPQPGASHGPLGRPCGPCGDQGREAAPADAAVHGCRGRGHQGRQGKGHALDFSTWTLDMTSLP